MLMLSKRCLKPSERKRLSEEGLRYVKKYHDMSIISNNVYEYMIIVKIIKTLGLYQLLLNRSLA